MKALAKLKDDARKHEQKEEWEKAIEAYVQVLRTAEGGESEAELPLYNRIGDLFVRLGRPIDAVTYYERAADQYAEAGLYNNAIALCNKALRYLPSRLELLRKLGQFSAAQGFITDARRWYLEFAERQLKQGALEDAFRALEDCAHVHEDAEIRELLGRHLYTHNRPVQAVAALTRARELRMQAGEMDVAQRLADEIHTIDPSAPLEASASAAAPSAQAPATETVAVPPSESARDFEPAAPVEDSWDAGMNIDLPGLDNPAALPTTGFTPDIDLSPATGGLELAGFEDETVEPAEESISSFDNAVDDSTGGLEAGLIDLDSIPGLNSQRDPRASSAGFVIPGLDLVDPDVGVDEDEVVDLPFLTTGAEEDVEEVGAEQSFNAAMFEEDEFVALEGTAEEETEPLPFLEVGESDTDEDVFIEPQSSDGFVFEFESAEPEDQEETTGLAEPEELVTADDFEREDVFTFERSSFDEPAFAGSAVADTEPELSGDGGIEGPEYTELEGLSATELEAESFDSFTPAQIEVESFESAEAVEEDVPAHEFFGDFGADELEETPAHERDLEEPAIYEAEPAQPAPFEFVPEAVNEFVAEPAPVVSGSVEPSAEPTPDIRPIDIEPMFEPVAQTEPAAEMETAAQPEPYAGSETVADVEPAAAIESDEHAPQHEPIPGWVPPEPPPGVEAPHIAPQPVALDGARELERIRQLISAGSTMSAVHELDALHPQLAASGQLRQAWEAADAMLQLDPNSQRILQQRVEYAAASGDYDLGLRSYLDLGRFLRRAGADAKARVIFQRVLDLDPHNAEAKSFVHVAEPPKVTTGYVDLHALISEDDKEETTRFMVEETQPTGDEERDFADMLSQFKQKVAENVAFTDSGAHYDLGLAFKEMGLVDEAIAEFQVALKGGEERLKVYEELGHCFLLKQQYNVAVTVLNRALSLPVRDDSDLLGVYYSLARSYEGLGRTSDARAAYERVVSLDINFQDATERLGKL